MAGAVIRPFPPLPSVCTSPCTGWCFLSCALRPHGSSWGSSCAPVVASNRLHIVPDPESRFHAIVHAEPAQAAAFIAALSRALALPRGSAFLTRRVPVQVWVCHAPDGVMVCLSDSAMEAAQSAFATVPPTVMLKGAVFPAPLKLLITGPVVAARRKMEKQGERLPLLDPALLPADRGVMEVDAAPDDPPVPVELPYLGAGGATNPDRFPVRIPSEVSAGEVSPSRLAGAVPVTGLGTRHHPAGDLQRYAGCFTDR